MRVTEPRGEKMWVVRERWEGGVRGGEVRIVVERWMEEAVLGMARMMVVVQPLGGVVVPLVLW